MTQVVGKGGDFVGVTVLEAAPNVITALRTKEKDGYSSLQLGYETRKTANKPKTGHLKKSGLKNGYLKEFKIDTELAENLKVGQKIDLSDFEQGAQVQVQGFCKGSGFQGVIKKHNFHRGPKTHGSHHYRAPGSIGQCSFPARVFKGKKMPGRQGVSKITIKNLQIIKVDIEKNLLALKGSVPGKKGSFVAIKGL